MRSALAVLALAGSVAAQGVTELITPASAPPSGCGVTRQGAFQITIVNITDPAALAAFSSVVVAQPAAATAAPAASASAAPAKRDIVARQATPGLKPLEVTLTNGVLKDGQNRTGYVAENFQFQFDGPPQAGAIFTGGFSLCTNGSIALGGSAIWWQCLSGTFFNLYDRKWADHCIPCYFEAIGGAGSSVDLNAKPVIATATATASSASSSATGNSTSSGNSTETSSGSSSSSTSGSGSGSSGSGTSSSSSSQSSTPPAGSDATQLVPAVFSVLSLAAVICFNGLFA